MSLLPGPYVRCRTVESPHHVPLLDEDHWQRITRGRHVTITSLAREPHLLRLEPNVNCKMVRREFIDRIGLEFPRGLLFEDLPSHVRLFGRAKSIALVSETGLYYRAGGAGQLTTIKGLRRFDMIEVAELALEEAQDCHLGTMAGAALVGQAARMLYWCGQNVPTQDTFRYFSKAAAVMRAYPIAWRQAFLNSVPNDLRERIIVSAFNANATGVLAMMAQKYPQPLSVLRFALGREGRVLRPLIRVRASARRFLDCFRGCVGHKRMIVPPYLDETWLSLTGCRRGR